MHWGERPTVRGGHALGRATDRKRRACIGESDRPYGEGMHWGATDCKGRACNGERPTVTGGHALGSDRL